MVQFYATLILYENEFDLIGCFNVLEHIKEGDEVLKQINKALVEGGYYYCPTTQVLMESG